MQSGLGLQESQQIHLLQHSLHFFFCGIGLRHFQVLLYRTLEQVTVAPNQHHPFQKFFFPHLGKRNAANGDGA